MVNRVIALYFSPTHTTKKVVTAIANAVSTSLSGLLNRTIVMEEIDITTPLLREKKLVFSPEDMVVFGSPVYIGRMPNLISPYFKQVKGGGALGVAVAVYGNRAYDDGLIELRDIMVDDGFNMLGAAAFIGEHSFSNILGGGRPDDNDLQIATSFGKKLSKDIVELYTKNSDRPNKLLEVPGTPYPYSGFYNATDTSKKSVDIRKAVPNTDVEKCDKCGLCAKVCSMGSIDLDDCTIIVGKCIKCSACVKLCPRGAKYFDDEQFLGHLKVLERNFTSPRKEPELFYLDV